jgi:hypothetical protein
MKIALENQAKLVLIVCVVQIIFFQIAAAMLPISLSDKIVIFFMIFISLGVSTIYLTYSINCMTAGHCDTFAWVLAGFVIFGVVFSLLSSTMAMTLNQQGFRKALMDNPKLKMYVDSIGVPQAAEPQRR